MSKHWSVPLGDGSRAMIDSWGGDELSIEVDGRVYQFEFSKQFGPMVLNKSGGERTLPPRQQNLFLRAVSLWNVQGQRFENGKAIWHEPRKPVLKHLGGQHYLVIEDGEIGHDW